MITYPLNDVKYTAENAELFNCPRKSGVYSGDDDFRCTVTGTDNTVTVSAGVGWIRNSKFSGKVVAELRPKPVDIGIPDQFLDRIDVVMIQFNKAANKSEITMKKGETSSKPVMPAIVQTESIYELYLCSVYRRAGFAAISASDVTDLRLDPSVCGLMADAVTSVDTEGINAEAKSLIEDLRKEIASVKDGSAFLMKSGGKMTGSIDMGWNSLVGLAAPVAPDAAVRLKYLQENYTSKEEQAAYVVKTGSNDIPETYSMYYRIWSDKRFEAFGTAFCSYDNNSVVSRSIVFPSGLKVANISCATGTSNELFSNAPEGLTSNAKIEIRSKSSVGVTLHSKEGIFKSGTLYKASYRLSGTVE